MERSVAMVMVECAASLPSSSLALRAHVQTRIASVASTWAYFPVQETEGSRVLAGCCRSSSCGNGGIVRALRFATYVGLVAPGHANETNWAC